MNTTKNTVALLLTLVLTPLCWADSISGRITDQSGTANLEGALVTLDGLNRSTTTDRFGEYRIGNLPIGDYTVIVSYIGTAQEQAAVTVPASGVTLNLSMGEKNVSLMENVLVIGSAAAQAGALNQQRASDAIMSVIDSDGLGNFPDTTVADSLSRVVGLSIENDQGEGRYVSIRGINTDLISSSINGVRTPSPEDRRGVLLDGVPSDLLSSIEVQKSLTPNLDADSLGGYINMKTVSAFDRKERFLRAKIEGRFNDIADDASPKATLSYSEVFNDRIGVALSVNYQNLAIESHNNEAGGWGQDDDTGLYFMDDDYEQRWYDLTRQRLGLVANFEFRANDTTDLYLRTLYNRYEDDEVRNKFEYRDLDDGEPISATSSIVPINEVDAEVRMRNEIRQIQTYALGGNTQKNNWGFDYEVAYAYAEEDDSDNHDVTFRYEDIQDNGVGDLTFNTSSPERPLLTGDAALASVFTASNYFLDEFEQEFTVNEDTETSAKFDITLDSLINDTPVMWKAGLKLRDREKIRDVNKNIYEADDLSLSAFAGDQFVSGWRLQNQMPAFPDPNLTVALRGNAQGNLELDDDATNFDSIAEDFTIDERITAVYGMGTFDISDLTVVAGIRIEQTDVDLLGTNFAEEDDPANLLQRNLSKDYTNVLPSLNLKYSFTDNLIGRAAYYAAVVRPGFGEMAPFARLNDDQDEVELGNSNLDPYEADNFDLSLEFYPTELSIISAGLFYKKIDNPIFDATYDIADLPASVDLNILTAVQQASVEEVSTFINADSSNLYGIELNYVQQFGFLGDTWDGYMVSANLTLTDSEATLPDGREVPFLKQSETVGNLAIGYDKGAWDLRVSANYRGEYLDELIDENLDRYTDARLLIEASAKYKVNDSLQLYIEGKNLTDEPEYYYFGNKSRLSQYDEFGKSWLLGARMTF